MMFVGIGFRGAATQASLNEAYEMAVATANAGTPDGIVTETAKARAEVFRGFAQSLGLPGLGVRAEDMAHVLTTTQSARLLDKFGTGSLAEAAALLAAGPGATLVATRVVSGDGMATAAIAASKG